MYISWENRKLPCYICTRICHNVHVYYWLWSVNIFLDNDHVDFMCVLSYELGTPTYEVEARADSLHFSHLQEKRECVCMATNQIQKVGVLWCCG